MKPESSRILGVAIQHQRLSRDSGEFWGSTEQIEDSCRAERGGWYKYIHRETQTHMYASDHWQRLWNTYFKMPRYRWVDQADNPWTHWSILISLDVGPPDTRDLSCCGVIGLLLWLLLTKSLGVLEKNEILMHVTAWMNLEDITLSEIHQKQRTSVILLCLYEIPRIGKFIGTNSRLEVTRGHGEGRMRI